MRKGLTLFFTAITMFAMGLTACGSNTSSTSNIPEWSIHDDGHLFHYEDDLGYVIGPKGDTGAQGEKGDKGDTGAQGEQGIQGEKGDKGDTGETGAQGPKGDQGEKGDKGDTGNGIDHVERSNDGKNDTYTFVFTDGSSFSFSVPNAPVRISATPLRDSYYVGEDSLLGVTVYAYFSDDSVLEVTGFEVSGFDTDTVGKKEVTVSFGGQTDSFSVNVLGAADAIDAVADLMTDVFGQEISANHNDNGDYIVLNMGDMDAATLEYYCDLLFIPDGFEAAEDWAADSFSDGTPVDYIDYVCGNVALEYLVYEVSGYEGDQAGYNGTYLQIQAFELSNDD